MADIILIAVLLIFIRVGAKRGLIKTLFGAISTLLSLLLTAFIYHPVSQILYKSKVGDYVREFLEKLFEEKIQRGINIMMFDEAVETASILAINVLSFLVAVITIKLVLILISNALNITAKLPVIKQLNSILGMITGAAGGMLICYIIIGIIGVLNGEGNISIIQESIENSYLAIKMYENNFISNLLLGYLF